MPNYQAEADGRGFGTIETLDELAATIDTTRRASAIFEKRTVFRPPARYRPR